MFHVQTISKSISVSTCIYSCGSSLVHIGKGTCYTTTSCHNHRPPIWPRRVSRSVNNFPCFHRSNQVPKVPKLPTGHVLPIGRQLPPPVLKQPAAQMPSANHKPPRTGRRLFTNCQQLNCLKTFGRRPLSKSRHS